MPATARARCSRPANGPTTRIGTFDELHGVLRHWRSIGDSYHEPRLFVTEAVVSGSERMSRYVRPDEMHTTFNFDYLTAGWNARRLREVIDNTLQALAPIRAPATWVLSSHDETRHVTRFGRADTAAAVMGFDSLSAHDRGTDLALGTRRARGRPAHPGASRRCLHLPR